MSDDKKFTPSDQGKPMASFPDYGSMRKLKLGDGTEIAMADLIREDLYSAFMLHPWHDSDAWDLYAYGVQMGDLPGALPGTRPTRAHTNVPRSGETGLPRDWQMQVWKWRATLSAPLDQTILDWASETTAQFHYNGKSYVTRALVELLLHPCSLGEQELPVHIREHLSYGANIRTENKAVLVKLREWLRGPLDETVRDAATELNVIAGLVRDEAVATSLRRVQAKLQPGRSITCWLHLDGLLLRAIV